MNDQKTRQTFNRREAALIIGASFVGHGLLAKALGTVPTRKSVFDDPRMPDGAMQYRLGDKEDVIFGLCAVWLMVTTADWSPVLVDPKWRAAFAKELKIDPSHVEKFYGALTANPDVFKKAQELFISSVQQLNVYHLPPCPSGKSIKKVAALKSAMAPARASTDKRDVTSAPKR